MNYKINVLDDIKYVDINDVLVNKNDTLENEINKLNQNNIIVIGLYNEINSNGISIYEKYKKIEEKNFNTNYSDILFKIYSITKDINIRNEIVNLNYKFVNFVISKLKFNRRMYDNDLLSVGYIGLIKAVENFDLSLNYKFSTYAYYWIKGFIIKKINEVFNLPNSCVDNYVKEIKSSESENIFDSEYEIYENALDRINQEMKANSKWLNFRKERINIAFPMNLSEVDSEYYIDENMDKEIDYAILKEKLKEFLKTLPVRKEIIIRLYYDLDGRGYDINKIIDKYNIGRSYLYRILRTINHYNKSNEFEELLDSYYPEIFDEETKIIKK